MLIRAEMSDIQDDYRFAVTQIFAFKTTHEKKKKYYCLRYDSSRFVRGVYCKVCQRVR